MNIPQVYREKIASSVVGTPGVDTSGQKIGESIAQPAFELAEKVQNVKDEASYNALMVQHKTNIMTAAEQIKKDYAGNPEAAGPAMLEATKKSIADVTAMAPNPRVKLLASRGDPFAETWGLKDIYQWGSQQEYKNTIEHAKAIIDDSGHQMALHGANLDLSVSDIKDKMSIEINRLASEVAAVEKSKHPEMGAEILKKGMQTIVQSPIMAAMDTQPEKAYALAHDSDIMKYLPANEIKSLQVSADTAVKAFPLKLKEQQIANELSAHPEYVNQVYEKKLGYSEIDAMQKKGDIREATGNWLKEMATAVAPTDANAVKDKLKATLYSAASNLGIKIDGDPTKLATKEENKVIMSKNIKDLYKLQDDIDSAAARGILTPTEAQQLHHRLDIPLVAMTMAKHEPTMWQKIANAGTGGVYNALLPAKVKELNTVSNLVDEYTTRHHMEENFVNKSAFYDAYFKKAEEMLKPGAINAKTNAPYTPADIMHSIMGEGIGDSVKTPVGLKPITGYDKKTGEPHVEYTKEEEDLIRQKRIQADMIKALKR